VKEGDDYVLIGKYPSNKKRYADWFWGGMFWSEDFSEFGQLFHHNCYLQYSGTKK
jgi:hypothetical protein